MPGLPFIGSMKNKTHIHMYSILKIALALLEPLQGSICSKLHLLHTKSGSENMWDMDYQEWGIWGDLHKTCRTWHPMEERSFMSNWSLQCKRIALYFRYSKIISERNITECFIGLRGRVLQVWRQHPSKSGFCWHRGGLPSGLSTCSWMQILCLGQKHEFMPIVGLN